MAKREVLLIDEGNGEVASFISRLRKAGSLTIELNGELFLLEISLAKITEEGRTVLTRGGPGGLEP